MDKIDLATLASKIGADVSSRYENNSKQRALLLEFMEANDWFDVEYSVQGRSAQIPSNDIEKFKDRLTLWLAAFKQPGSVKIELMLNLFRNKYPSFCTLYNNFVIKKPIDKTPCYWQLLDYLLCELTKDIDAYSESEIRELSMRLNADAPLSVAEVYSDFITSASIDGKALSQWIYKFEARGNSELNIGAYALDNFAVLAYYVFNSDAWVEQNLVQKALSNTLYAELWLSTALHFICALRKTDMKRFPAPRLPQSADVIRLQLETNSFPNKTAAAITDELVMRINMASLTPSKTASHSSIPTIKFSVPESLRAVLGTIIAIVLLHHPEIKPGDTFVVPRKEIRHMRTFFGEHFAEAIGNRNFDTRRANKAYLQGIDLIANVEGTPGRPKGYMLATLARGHKSSIDALSQTTDIYLKDANFAGYTPEFIAREMFERGVFGFIPAILLEMYAGSQYKALPVGVQTKLIEVLGLSAGQIEAMASTVEASLSRSKRVVASFFAGNSDIKSNVFRILQNIASGNAPGKQNDYLCLMTAATRICPSPDRNGCAGCEYEILTKSVMHSLMREYVRMSEIHNTANGAEHIRYGRLLERTILPAVAEVVVSAQLLYPDIRTDTLLDIMEEGLDYVNNTPRDGNRESQMLAAVGAT